MSHLKLNHVFANSCRVSPKTLATAFEHCLGRPERSSTSTPRKLPSPVQEDKIPDADKMFEGRSNGEKDGVLDSVLGRAVDGEAGQQQPSDKKGPKNILLVEDNQVNLKVATQPEQHCDLSNMTDHRNVRQNRRLRLRHGKERAGSLGKVQGGYIRRSRHGLVPQSFQHFHF